MCYCSYFPLLFAPSGAQDQGVLMQSALLWNLLFCLRSMDVASELLAWGALRCCPCCQGPSSIVYAVLCLDGQASPLNSSPSMQNVLMVLLQQEE